MDRSSALFVFYSTIRIYLTLMDRVGRFAWFDPFIGCAFCLDKTNHTRAIEMFGKRANALKLLHVGETWKKQIDELVEKCNTREDAKNIQEKMFYEFLDMPPEMEDKWACYRTMFACFLDSTTESVKDAIEKKRFKPDLDAVIGLVWLEFSNRTYETIKIIINNYLN